MMGNRLAQHHSHRGQSRPTIADVAERAGVSVATVDRVINARLPVKEATSARVREAAEALGFHATSLIRQRTRPDRTTVTLGFLLQRHSVQFYGALGAALEAATRLQTKVQGRAIVEYLDDLTPTFVAERLRQMADRCDGIAIVAADHPHVTRAIADLRDRGKPVVALLSDLSAPARTAYVGVDWRKMGRTAGWAMSNLTGGPGDIAIIIGSHRYLATEVCEICFRTYLRENAPGLNLLEPMINFEEPRLAYQGTLELLQRAPNLVGIYMVGGGVEGVMGALREAGVADRVAAICHDLTDNTREGLIDGVLNLVLHQPREAMAAAAVRSLCEAVQASVGNADGRTSEEASGDDNALDAVPSQIVVPVIVYTAENI